MGKIADRFSRSKNKKRKRTGDCFVTAAKMQQDKLTDWTLVHGAPMGRGGAAEGIRFPHAWLQNPENTVVFDPNLHEKGIDPYIPLQAYYDIGNILWTITYSLQEASEKMLETGVYGPWHQKLIDLDRKIG
jgi:hypothetical protein